jgi:hypothetical protein
VSDARGGGVIAIRIQKFGKYYRGISSTYSGSGCGLQALCPHMGEVYVFQVWSPWDSRGGVIKKYIRGYLITCWKTANSSVKHSR